DGIRDFHVTGVQTCALPIYVGPRYRRVGDVERHDAEAEPRVERLIRQIKSPSGSRGSRRQAVDLDPQDQPFLTGRHSRVQKLSRSEERRVGQEYTTGMTAVS